MDLRRRALAAGVLLAALASVALTGTALGNGIGDLYAATPRGVAELYVKGASTVVELEIAPGPNALAFSPDGHHLYTAAGRRIVHIDIETISVAGELALPGRPAALAFPAGRELVVALPDRRTLGLIEGPNGDVVETRPFAGAPDLLAADRRDPRVVVAQRGASWLSVYHLGDRQLRSSSLQGRIVALAVDRDTGSALVATTRPDRLTRVDLRDLNVLSSVALPASPLAVAPTLDGPVVASARTLYRVSDDGVRRWASAKGDVTRLAASDDGRVVLVSQAERIEAFGKTGKAIRELRVANVAALAAIPAPSSVSGEGDPDRGQGGDLPSTSTVLDEGARWLGGRREIAAAIAAGALVGGLALVLGAVAIRRRSSRRTG